MHEERKEDDQAAGEKRKAGADCETVDMPARVRHRQDDSFGGSGSEGSSEAAEAQSEGPLDNEAGLPEEGEGVYNEEEEMIVRMEESYNDGDTVNEVQSEPLEAESLFEAVRDASDAVALEEAFRLGTTMIINCALPAVCRHLCPLDSVLTAIDRWSAVPRILVRGIQLLNAMVLRVWQDKLQHCAVAKALSWMSEHEKDAWVQHEGWHFVDLVCEKILMPPTAALRISEVESDGRHVEHLLRSLDHFWFRSDVQEAGLDRIRCLAADGVVLPEHQGLSSLETMELDDEEREGCMLTVLRAMLAHVGEEGVQLAGCRALCALRGQQNAATMLGMEQLRRSLDESMRASPPWCAGARAALASLACWDDATQLPSTQQLGLAMESPSAAGDVLTLSQAYRALAAIALTDANLREVVGLIEPLLTSLARLGVEDEGRVREAFCALAAVLQHPEARARAVSAGAVACILSATDTFAESPEVLAQAFTALAWLRPSDGSAESEAAVLAVSTAMMLFEGHAGTQSAACRLLRVVADRGGSDATLIDSGAVGCVGDCLRRFWSPRKGLSGTALEAMSTLLSFASFGGLADAVGASDVLGGVAAAMTRRLSDARVQQGACQVLALLARSPRCIEQVQERQVLSVLCKTVHAHAASESVTVAAMSAMRLLVRRSRAEQLPCLWLGELQSAGLCAGIKVAVFGAVLAAMEGLPSCEEVQQTACELLLALDEPCVHAGPHSADGLEELVAEARRHPAMARSVQRRLAERLVVADCLVAALRQHPSSIALRRSCKRLLRRLDSYPALADMMAGNGIGVPRSSRPRS